MTLTLPETLTPSKIGSFVHCPLAFRYAYIDRLPEPSATYLIKGTLVHRALQKLYSKGSVEDRTPERGQQALDEAWQEMQFCDEVTGLELDDATSKTLVRESRELVERYFALEDPQDVNPIGLELDLRATVGGVELRGIIDRLDHLPGDELAVVDYKTGRAPRADHARSALSGVYFYGFLCEAALGRRPREVRLMYLKDRVVIVESLTDQGIRGLRQRALAVWAAIERACASNDFRPNPTPLCKSCNFKAYCPSFGGEIFEAGTTD